jgi:hypothetical protein
MALRITTLIRLSHSSSPYLHKLMLSNHGLLQKTTTSEFEDVALYASIPLPAADHIVR